MATPLSPGRIALQRRQGFSLRGRTVERGIEIILLGCASLAILVTLGIVYVLVSNSIKFFESVSVWEFLTGTTWNPDIEPTAFGVLPLLNGTLMVTLGA